MISASNVSYEALGDNPSNICDRKCPYADKCGRIFFSCCYIFIIIIGVFLTLYGVSIDSSNHEYIIAVSCGLVLIGIGFWKLFQFVCRSEL